MKAQHRPSYTEREQAIRAETSDRTLLRCRLLIHQLSHYEAMLSAPDNLHPEQRKGIAAWIDRLHSAQASGQKAETKKWVALVGAILHARETNHTFAASGKQKDLILIDSGGKNLYRGAEGTDAKITRAMGRLSSEDPDLARAVTAKQKALRNAIEAYAAGRHKKGEKRAELWPALIALGQSAGLQRIAPRSLQSLYERNGTRARRARRRK